METQRRQKQKNNDWFLRFVKGMFIGSGFILPGVSGGALAAIFGMYERIISFLANMSKNFKENILYFIPVGLGALSGIVLLSFGVSFLLGNYETIILWFFIGSIVGTIPTLWKEAGKQGRTRTEWIILVAAFILGCLILLVGNHFSGGKVPVNYFTWMIAGGLIALGIIVPGLSPSNFIVYMGIYKDMSDGFKSLDIGIILPIFIGMILTVFTFSKLIHRVFQEAYPQMFHFIFGIVLASTVLIIPVNYQGFTFVDYLACLGLLLLGISLGSWMCKLEDTYK